MRRNWIILDRDGTLIVEKNYLHEPDEVEMLPHVVEGLKLLSDHGYVFTVVTNQSGIGRGYFKSSDVDQVHEKIKELLRDNGVELQGIYMCPHRPEDHCHCRKPETGLIRKAMEDSGFSLKNLVGVIGDKSSDVELGKTLGVSTVLVMTGYGRSERSKGVQPDYYAESFAEAAWWILTQSREKAVCEDE